MYPAKSCRTKSPAGAYGVIYIMKASAKNRTGEQANQGPPVDAQGVLHQSPEEYGVECGGEGGVPYSTFVRPPDRITSVTVWHRVYVDGLQLETSAGPLPKIGATGLNRDIREESFQLQPDEFLTGVSVEYWSYIDRITFHSNQRSYGPFGGTGGRVKKKLDAPPGRVVAGFKGRHWHFIDSLQLMIL